VQVFVRLILFVPVDKKWRIFVKALPSYATSRPTRRRKSKIEKLARESLNFLPFIVVGIAIFLMFQAPADAACAGWLCGVKDKLNATEGFKDGKTMWEMLFVGAQAVIVVLFGLCAFFIGLKVRKEESWIEFFALMLLFLLILFVTNYVAAKVMGVDGAGTAQAAADFMGI
jgi:dolichyl-phosphate-mannose--protein O-mannosyl transferase